MSVIDTGSDVEHIEQTGKFRQVKARWDAWKTKWDNGKSWGIVGGSPLRNLPDTVLGQVTEHGKSTYARDRAKTIEGLGELLEAVSEILDGDAILTKDKDDLEDAISQMEIVLGSRQWNPRNIPFHTVIKFRETENPKKPKITRGLVRGHYRTDAYNQYVEWALKHKKDFKGQLADTDPSWYDLDGKMGQARPPLWMAITGEEQGGILSIGRAAMEAVIKLKIGDNIKYRIYGGSKGPEILATIPSVIEHVKAVVQMPDIYPGGKSRAPVKDRLNAKFSNHTYSIANEEEARLFEKFVRGWDRYVGLEKVKQVRLSFPPNNLALNKLIIAVMGDEMDTHQKPGTDAKTQRTGLVLKSKKDMSWKDIIKIEKNTGRFLNIRTTRCLKPDCPYGPNQTMPNVTDEQAKRCSKIQSSACVGNRMRR